MIHWIMVHKYNQILISWISLVILLVKSLPAMRETLVWFWIYECYSRWEKVIKINKWDREIICACVLSQSCPIFCNPMDHSQLDSSVHGISQEWVAISSSRGSSPPKDRTQVSCSFCIAGWFFTAESSGKPKTITIILIWRRKIEI